MIRLFSGREIGDIKPIEFYRTETSRRVSNLQLSVTKDVEKIFAGTINSLDLDLVERR